MELASRTTIQRERSSDRLERWRGWPLAFVAVVAAAVLAFVAAPWPIEGKSLAVVHGLCAQQPSHTFFFGNQRLPFDARMTGIYGGVAVAVLFLFARGRWRAGGVPSVGVLALLAAGVLALGVDGVNSTLTELGAAHLYPPHNVARLLTGLWTGVTLAAFVWLLLGQVAFAPSPQRRHPVVRDVRELGMLLGPQAVFVLAVLSAWPPLRVPLTVLLLGAAVGVLTGLVLAFILLIGRRENVARDTWQLAGPATLALVVALAVLGLTAGGRFLLEAMLQLPPPGSA